MTDSEATLEDVTRLHLICVMRATGQISDFSAFGGRKTDFEAMEDYSDEYEQLRRKVLKDPRLVGKVPPLVKGARNFDEFWGAIKGQVSGYEARRVRLNTEFHPLFESLKPAHAPTEGEVAFTFGQLNWQAVSTLWRKALDRRESDPAGAITAAKSMVESVCKHILESSKVPYKSDDDLPTLYHAASSIVGLNPKGPKTDSTRKILGACTTAVSELAALRNKQGDAHGPGLAGSLTNPDEAALAVNLAGTVSTMLAQAWVQTSSSPKSS